MTSLAHMQAHKRAAPLHTKTVLDKTLALAIGCGAKPIPWMNDSGFWVVGKLAGLTEKETLQTFSVVIALQGIVGMLAVLAFAYLFPHFLF